MARFTPTSQLGTNNSLRFDLTDRFCGWQAFSGTNHGATNCEIIVLQSKQNEECYITASYVALSNGSFTLRKIDRYLAS